MNIYNKLKHTSTGNVLPMEIDIMFEINANSFLTDKREGTDLDTLSHFTKKINFDFRNSKLASYLAIQRGPNYRKQRWKTFKWQRRK